MIDDCDHFLSKTVMTQSGGQLQQQGDEVERLILLDAYPGHWLRKRDRSDEQTALALLLQATGQTFSDPSQNRKAGANGCRESDQSHSPGGRVVVREPDWDTLIVDHSERNLTRQILTLHFDQAIRHSSSGRELYRLFRQAGLEQVTVADASTLILTDFSTANRLYGLEDAAARAKVQMPELSTQISTWLADLQQADHEGLFFSAVTGFTVVGYKPAQS